MNSETRQCQNCKVGFTIEPEDFDFYEKIKVPPPTWCPECRMIRRMLHRNERTLYRDICDLCGRQMLSMYSPDKPFTVYCRDCWLSDKWNPLESGAEYDWQRPFFEQWHELMKSVPKIAVAHYHTNVNSEYGNFIANDKNVYLAYSIIGSEDIYYSRSIDDSRGCIDSFNLDSCETAYESSDGHHNHNTIFAIQSRECLNSAFLFDCVNCQQCFMSSNMRNGRFIIRNKQYTKEAYEQEMVRMNHGGYQALEELKKEFFKIIDQSLHKFGNLVKTTDCSGDNIENSKNVHHTFEAYDSENLKFGVRIIGAKDSCDLTGSMQSELLYECVAGGSGSYESKFSTFLESTRDSYFADWCHGSSQMFGCFGLRNKQYYILNKQYTKEEYEKLVPKIIEHMNSKPYVDKLGREYRYGEFFPPELSPFAYNETIAQEYFPMAKDEALAKGYHWRDPDTKSYIIIKKPKDLPDHIKDVEDGILKGTIGCAHEGKCNQQCTTAFKIIPEELSFYHRMNLPLPRLCPNCRHYERLKQRNPLKLWHRRCHCNGSKSQTQNPKFQYENTAKHFHGAGPCPNEFETSYAPDRPEIVYCESCYNSEVV